MATDRDEAPVPGDTAPGSVQSADPASGREPVLQSGSNTGSAIGNRFSAFLRWMESSRVSRYIAIFVSVAALLSGVATYAVFTGHGPMTGDTQTLLLLLNVDLVLLLVLGVFIIRRVVRVWMERRRGSAGARLHVRLVVIFAALSVTPAIVVAVFSYLFFDLGLESWFSERVRTAVEESVAVASAYLKEHQNTIRADALRIARDLDNEASVFANNPKLMNQALNIQSRLRNVTEAVIFQGSGEVLARAGLTFVLEFEPVSESALQEARRGEVVLLTSQQDDRVRALVKLDNYIDTFLYIGRFVDPAVLGHMERTQSAVEQFHNLEGRRSEIKISFALAFIVVALLLLLASVWVGLMFATHLSRPISTLIRATEKVREGDLEVQVPVEAGSEDEIGSLSRAFNRMTEQLNNQRGALLEANRLLDERRRFTEAVLSGVTAGVIGLDPEGRINLPNRAAEKLLDTELTDRINASIGDVVPEFGEVFNEFKGLGNRSSIEREVKLVRGEETRTLLVRIGVEQGREGLYGYVVTFDDMTMLVSAQRTAAWADVARRIAHEIKNPLTPIQLSAERLKRKYLKEIQTDPKVFETCTDTIIRQVGDIGRMVDEFSNFARMPMPTMADENIVEICRQAVFLQRNANVDTTYLTDFPDQAVRLKCDSRQIAQVITNLLQNAHDAIEGLPADRKRPGRISLGIHQDEAGHVLIEIEDNGKGLPKENRDRLTEPYVTTRAKGTGLGLAIVKKIMEDHGGTIELADAPEEGAIIRLVFPSTTEDVPSDEGVHGGAGTDRANRSEA